MSLTRKEFCRGVAGATVLLLLQGCGGGGGSYGGASAAGATPGCGAGDAAIAANHGHVLTIAQGDLDSIVAKTYSIRGTSDHDHSVTFTPAQLQDLKAGKSVTVVSTVAASMLYSTHSHDVMASCM